MFKIPDSRLSASNSAVLASESFLVPMTLRSEARSLQSAFDELQRSFDQVRGFIPQLTSTVPGVEVLAFDAAVSPRVSRVDVARQGKDYRFDLTFALRCPIPKGQDFWARVQFVAVVYDRLSELVAVFEDRKGIDLYLEEARLDQQKEDPERLRMFRK
jgi:hypothetical protein